MEILGKTGGKPGEQKAGSLTDQWEQAGGIGGKIHSVLGLTRGKPAANIKRTAAGELLAGDPSAGTDLRSGHELAGVKY